MARLRFLSLLVPLLRRLLSVVLTLVVILYITLFGLIMAERGREGLPAEPGNAALQAIVRTGEYFTQHPETYYWSKQTFPALDFVLMVLGRSAGLLFLGLAAALILGVPLGVAAALARRRVGASLVLVLSILGVSVPSFLLAMFFWILNIGAHRYLGLKALPSVGFGWDAHMIMPALVLAARPLAQIAQVTYVSLSDVLGQDYVRTARAKGLSWPYVRNRHALRNVLIPILNTAGTSLRFSLASLPVVEFFFIWPGVGLTLLQAIEMGLAPLVADLILSLGLLFLLLNLFLEFLFPFLDPRLRSGQNGSEERERSTFREWWRGAAADLVGWWDEVRDRLAGRREREKLPPLPVAVEPVAVEAPAWRPAGRRRMFLRATLGNPALLVGLVLVLALFGLAVFGGRLTTANPYELHGVMKVEGTIGVPPFPPSSVFPWGTDHLGRDIQSLVLNGARQTLVLVLFSMLARIVLGTVLGLLAGWWRGGIFDRLVSGAVGVWAAFPVTLFAMLLIQALGIQQGMGVFVFALAVVGWGEVAQFVRAQVITVKPELYITAARSIGSRPLQILVRHVIPHLVAPLLVLASLEMGGVMMLLAELGFLNIFMGGGYRVMIAETGRMVPVIVHYSDVPEWAALLANIRTWWRSYPWLAWAPGIAVFLAIVAFNLFGEGLRRFLSEARVNLSRLVNRYTLGAVAAGVVILVLVLRSAAPLGVYQPEAMRFDAQRTIEDMRVLASPEMAGRENCMPGGHRAADYIAARMDEIGLFPAGDNGTYIQTLPTARGHLGDVPRLEILDEEGTAVTSFAYRQDFVEYTGLPTYGENGQAMVSTSSFFGLFQGPVVGLALGDSPVLPGEVQGQMPGIYNQVDPFLLRNYWIDKSVVIVREDQVQNVNMRAVGALLIVTADPMRLQEKYLYTSFIWSQGKQPVMYITPQTADRLLATAGSSIDELTRLAATLPPSGVAVTDSGAVVSMATQPTPADEEAYYNVLGYITGEGQMVGLADKVVVVSAYYDGLGIGPDGTLYPGANDNASGVAMMLELARLMKSSPYPPKRTVIFVAWSGGERGESLSLSNVLSSKTGFTVLEIEVVVELSGVGAGTGEAIALGQGSSFRLVQLFQSAAGRLGIGTTTRGRDPHYGTVARTAFGGRSALSLYVSWDGSDYLAHTPNDTVETIDPEKLSQVGRTTYLGLLVLSRELTY
jgi:peptide/nickel transport system permease protein